MLQENENKEIIDLEKCNINDLIAKIEKDPLPTNIFTTEEDDPLVLLGKLNEVIACLKAIKATISASDSKANEALQKALDAVINASEAVKTAQEAKITAEDLGSEAKSTAENAVAIANGASLNANEAIATANEANEEAKSAHDLATDAIAEASSAIKTANEALEQVVAGLGTKVFDNHGQLMANAKFTGHNHINVDMDETDPETFNIRLDDTITTAIEDNHTQGQTNKSNLDALTQRVTSNESDIVNLTEMLSSVEEAVDNTLPNQIKNVSNDLHLNYVPMIYQSDTYNNAYNYQQFRQLSVGTDNHWVKFGEFSFYDTNIQIDFFGGVGEDVEAGKLVCHGTNNKIQKIFVTRTYQNKNKSITFYYKFSGNKIEFYAKLKDYAKYSLAMYYMGTQASTAKTEKYDTQPDGLTELNEESLINIEGTTLGEPRCIIIGNVLFQYGYHYIGTTANTGELITLKRPYATSRYEAYAVPVFWGNVTNYDFKTFAQRSTETTNFRVRYQNAKNTGLTIGDCFFWCTIGRFK